MLESHFISLLPQKVSAPKHGSPLHAFKQLNMDLSGVNDSVKVQLKVPFEEVFHILLNHSAEVCQPSQLILQIH